MNSFGDDLSDGGPAYGRLDLSDAFGTALRPAPISPHGAEALPFSLLSATIKAAVEDANFTDKKVKVRQVY